MTEPPGSRVAVIVTLLFCATPPISNVVAEALAATNAIKATAAKAARPIFNLMILSLAKWATR